MPSSATPSRDWASWPVLIPIAQVRDRVARAQDDSDVAYFYELLNAGEMATACTCGRGRRVESTC